MTAKMPQNVIILLFILKSLPICLNVCIPTGPTDGVPYPIASFIFNDTFENCDCRLTNTCLRKCCGASYVLEDKMCVLKSRRFEVNVYRNDQMIGDASSFSLLSGLMPCAEGNGYYRLDPKEFVEDEFLLQNDGRLWQPILNSIFESDQYCLEYFDDIGGVSALVCFPVQQKIAKRLNAIGMMISMPFLLATFFVYAFLPDRNLHGNSLMCYVISLFMAYVLLVSIQISSKNLNDASCTTLGLFCLFFFIVSFFWMNVMSIDIWWTFSGLRGFSGTKKEKERKRFLLYCGYAWGVPFLIVLAVTFLSTFGPSGKWYSPDFGNGQCWFRDGVPTLLYFYVPIAVLIIANIVLFGKTAFKIKQAKEDTAILRKGGNKKHNYEHDKQRFNLYLRLLLAMGVNWSMEVISWTVNWQVEYMPPAVWYLTDLCNALYGVYIFFMFAFKKNIWNLLKKRYYMVVGKLHLANTMAPNTGSPRTTETSLSNP